MKDSLEFVRTAAACFSAVGGIVALLAWLSLHKRARREKAIEYVRLFSASLSPQWSSTYKLVESLGQKELKDLAEGRALELDGKDQKDVETIESALPGSVLTVNGHKISLNSKQVCQLRYQALDVLNNAELVFQAWLKGVADEKIIVEEMSFICDPEAHPKTTLMAEFRRVAGYNGDYVAIKSFCKRLREVQEARDRTNTAKPEGIP